MQPLGEDLKQNGYARSLSEADVGRVCILFPVTCDKEHDAIHSHLTSYTILEIN